MGVLELGRMVVVQVYQCLWLSLLLADLSWHTALLIGKIKNEESTQIEDVQIKREAPDDPPTRTKHEHNSC